MKLIQMNMAQDGAGNARQIEKEIALHSKIKSCPSIARMKEHFVHEDKCCIVMEHMTGGDL